MLPSKGINVALVGTHIIPMRAKQIAFFFFKGSLAPETWLPVLPLDFFHVCTIILRSSPDNEQMAPPDLGFGFSKTMS